MIALRPQQLDQRIETIRGAFRKLGSVAVRQTPTGSPRTIEITVTAPGWPGLATTATMEFVETWVLGQGLWGLTKYSYDLFLEPKPRSGRYGHHWHNDSFHTHCWDPRVPDRDHHFEGQFVDIFEAFHQFETILAQDEGISCAGLRPARH